jgi:hypothetical protein
MTLLESYISDPLSVTARPSVTVAIKDWKLSSFTSALRWNRNITYQVVKNKNKETEVK